MDEDFNFVAEYAKSNRAACKKCKEKIDKDSLRMGILVQSPHYDGKMQLWHHLKCFFQKKTALKSTSEIANFSNLRWEDQENIKKQINGEGVSNGKAAPSKGSDFSVEYAKSNRSKCRGCEETITKGSIRISKIGNAPDNRYGPVPLWHHVDCFVEHRESLSFTGSAAELDGYNSLEDADKTVLLSKIGSSGVKRKADDEGPSARVKKAKKKENLVLKEQSKLLFDMRDKIKDNMSKKDMIELLELNEQHISSGEARLIDHLSDCLVFGALEKCPDCKNDSPRFLNDMYTCNGDLTEWTKCQYKTKYPKRKKCQIPEEFRESYEFLKSYKPQIRERKFADDDIPDSKKKNLPLDGFKIVLIGKFKDPVEKKVSELGSTISQKVDDSVNLCISSPDQVSGSSSKMKKVKELDIHVVSTDFIESVRKGSPIGSSIKEHLICTWGGDPILKFGIKKEHKSVKLDKYEKSMSKSKSGPQTLKLKVHGAAAVDPDSGLEDSCHVLQNKKDVYNVVLANVDITKGTNSFYKLQILETNTGKRFHLFRSWGRVGTTIGGNKVENYSNSADAIDAFKKLYLEKTLNEWKDRKNFEKRPGGMYPLEIDYGQDQKVQKKLKVGDHSKLQKAVQELICLIFDIEAMKKAMVEFEIDLEKMPLGKLSKKQIELAYKVLGEAQEILVTGCNSAKITDVTNRFFTLIPHDFGLRRPPLLDNEEIIKSKIGMLDSLMEIEIAYSLLKTDSTSGKDPVDEHYEKLMTDIDVLQKSCEEYNNIEKYLKNTHASTHNQYNLKLQQVFKINRRGESERYSKFKDLHNKKLLWHGSRLTNFVGILSQGLRIAPPEAPPTGYMFGKGVYFADMVSKSANYCFTNKMNSTGLLLLCEVALGNMYERTRADYISKLPKGMHSTFGMGKTVPDPSEKTFMGDVEVPYGKPYLRAQGPSPHSDLLYNEYIVYDVNQVNIKYLLKVDFQWKY